MNDYLLGCAVLGADPVYYGPESPAQLAAADRVLTQAEQDAVRDYQEKQADAQLAAVRATPGPKAQVAAVTPQGAVITRPKTVADAMKRPAAQAATVNEWPWWKIVLIVGGSLGAVGVVALAARRGASSTSAGA